MFVIQILKGTNDKKNEENPISGYGLRYQSPNFPKLPKTTRQIRKINK